MGGLCARFTRLDARSLLVRRFRQTPALTCVWIDARAFRISACSAADRTPYLVARDKPSLLASFPRKREPSKRRRSERMRSCAGQAPRLTPMAAEYWVPAFAGMTSVHDDARCHRNTECSGAFSTSIEAENSSAFLSGRAFSQKTGAHFSGKRSKRSAQGSVEARKTHLPQ